jgi:hypothetical protein
MQVYVEDVLSGCGTVCEEDVDALATQLGLPHVSGWMSMNASVRSSW